jgi:hypothetical protein
VKYKKVERRKIWTKLITTTILTTIIQADDYRAIFILTGQNAFHELTHSALITPSFTDGATEVQRV